MNASPAVGTVARCAETGAQFVITREGCSFNYATNSAGDIISDAGVDIRERRELLDRGRPFGCYVSSDGRSVTGWKGNILGAVVYHSIYRGGWGRSEIHCWTVRDVHGGLWHGRNAGNGMCINLRAIKA